MANPKIGFIGLGTMGMPMVLNLLDAGHAVTVWGRTPSKLEAALDAGADEAPSARSVAEASDIIMICVFDSAAVEDVVFGDFGASGGGAGKLLVDMSSIHPLRTREFAERLSRESGMSWVDAPVSGGPSAATDGTLIVMAGGADADIERLRPVMLAISQRLSHMGPVGCGQASKVCNQMIIGATVAVIAEAINFAAGFGVAAKDLPDCLAGGWADSTVLQLHARRMAAADYMTAAPANMMKDMSIARDMGRETGAPMPVTAMVTELYHMAALQGHADKGQIGLMRLYADGPL